MGILKICIVLNCILFIQIEASNTEATRPCPADSLPCSEGGCVARGKWCDGEEDCQDKSDEAYCKMTSGWSLFSRDPNSCQSSFFLCKNGPCIPLVGQCDGFDDCKDKSDEKNCETKTFDDYDDYMLSVSTTVAPTEITTIEPFSESEELENVDLTTATQTFFLQGVSLPSSTGSFYSQRMEEESLQTNIPGSTQPPTTKQTTLPVADPVTSQFKITNTITLKPLSLVTYTTESSDSSRRSSLNTIPTSTRPAFDPRRQSTPSPTSPTQPKRAGYQRSHDIQTSTPTYYPTRSYISGLVPDTKNTQTFSSPDRRNYYQLSTQTPRYLEARGTTSFQSQTHSTISYDTRRESHIYPNQPYVPPSSRNVNHNQPLRPVTPVQPFSSFPQTRTDTYQHQIHPIRSQGSSRTIIGNQQQYRPPSNLPTEPPYDNRPQTYDARQQPSRTRQQYHEDRQLPYDNRQQPYYNTPLPYDARQQPSVNRPQPYGNRQQPNGNRQEPFDNRPQIYDPWRNRDQYQPPISRQNSYVGQPTSQVGQSPLYENIPGAIIHGFQVKRIYSSDRKYYYEGYYNQDGHFVQTKFIQRLQPYTDRSPLPPKRPQPMTISTAAPVVFDGKIQAPSMFYFAKNYTKLYGHENSEFVEKARDWILSARDSDGGWGKDTPRALIALSLINNSFDNETFENSLMQKQFQVYLGTSLIRGDTKATSVNQLAMWVNVLLATCQNPRDFLGTDFTELVRNKLSRESEDRIIGARSVNPFLYLSLCLADRQLQRHEVHDLVTRLQGQSALDEFEQDKQTMALSAFACHLHQQRALFSPSSEYQRSMDSLLSNATSRLLKRMREDGSFGSLYSTAIAAQALMSVNDTQDWDPELTFDFLKEHQKDDGSFGDFLATYLVLPALSGRSLLHLRNTQCSPPNSDRALTPTEILAYQGPKQHVRYSLFIGYPKTNGYTIDVLVPKGISFYDIMRVAAHKNDAYKFSHEENDEEIKIYSISDIPNDSERGLEWNLFATSRSNLELDKPNPEELVRRDIRNYFPSSDQHIIFWYKPSDKWT